MARPSKDLRVDLTLPSHKITSGEEETIHFYRLENCQVCQGKGEQKRKLGNWFRGATPPTCEKCHGRGRIEVPRSIALKLPAGVGHGTRLKLAGEGNAGEPGEAPGDLYIYVSVQQELESNREESHSFQDSQYKNLLFVDQSLEELFTQYNSSDSLLIEPFKHFCDGNLEAANRSLGQILINPVAEIRHKLWVWKALRHLGETPPADSSDKVCGIVLEIPVNNWVDTLAVYSDGRARYLNGERGVDALVVLEDIENPRTKPLVMKMIDLAQSLVGETPVVDKHREESPTFEPRISVLTYQGLYIIDRDSRNQHLTDPILSTGTQLFFTLLEVTKQNK
jgi:hypothetical protein